MRPPQWIARILVLFAIALTISGAVGCGSRSYAAPPPPVPLLSAENPVDWWFAFKFNTANFPGCKAGAVRACQFGGQPQKYYSGFSQQFVYASSINETLQEGVDCLGDTLTDPVGATFDQIYNGDFNFVVWNDQFYNDPPIAGCTTFCDTPWGHSKGMLAWDNSGDGLVLQVTTPSWPAAGSKVYPRLTDGNTLGCVKDDDVLVSQQFFALRLTKADVLVVLKALANSSVVTDPANPQIVRSGGVDIGEQIVLDDYVPGNAQHAEQNRGCPAGAIFAAGAMVDLRAVIDACQVLKNLGEPPANPAIGHELRIGTLHIGDSIVR